MLVDDFAERAIFQVAKWKAPSAAEVAEDAGEVRAPHEREEPLDCRRLPRKLSSELSAVRVEVCRDVERRPVGAVEPIDRIHLDPLGLDAEVLQQVAGDRPRVPEERVEV